MNIEINDLLTIEYKEYAVSKIITYDNKTYYLLINIDNPADYKFCIKEQNKIYEELDINQISNLLLLSDDKK